MLKMWIKIIVFWLGAVFLLGSCSPAPAVATPTIPPQPPPTQAAPAPLPLATPYALQPASGICAAPQGDVLTFTLSADIPDPRCMAATAAQRLRVVNASGASLRVSIGPFTVTLAPGGDHLFDAPLGSYLLPGVHQVLVQPCCSPELWLK